jgi:hypothetical protein
MIDWTAWTPASCLPHDCFCEGDLGGAVRQPINTVSNLAFVLVGAWLFARAGGERRPAFARFYAAIVVCIGLSSAFYHASLSFVGQSFDVLAIYLLPTLVMLDNAAHERRRPIASLAWIYAAVNGAFIAMITAAPATRRPLVGVLALALVLSERRAGRVRDPKLLAWAMGSFVVAFAFWIPDRFQWLCGPASLPNGHALWHCLSAAAALLLYRYLASEKPGIAQSP